MFIYIFIFVFYLSIFTVEVHEPLQIYKRLLNLCTLYCSLLQSFAPHKPIQVLEQPVALFKSDGYVWKAGVPLLVTLLWFHVPNTSPCSLASWLQALVCIFRLYRYGCPRSCLWGPWDVLMCSNVELFSGICLSQKPLSLHQSPSQSQGGIYHSLLARGSVLKSCQCFIGKKEKKNEAIYIRLSKEETYLAFFFRSNMSKALSYLWTCVVFRTCH